MVEGAMQTCLDIGQPMSENVVSVEMNEQGTTFRLTEIEVSSKVILGYVSPSQFEVLTQTPVRNPDGTRIPTTFD